MTNLKKKIIKLEYRVVWRHVGKRRRRGDAPYMDDQKTVCCAALSILGKVFKPKI
jgi:hypothetical protein